MPKLSFKSPQKQAAHVMKKLQVMRHSSGSHSGQKIIRSVGTVRDYENSLTQVAKWLKENNLGSLNSLTVDKAHDFLNARSEEVGQSTLNAERQAMECMLRHFSTNGLDENQKLNVVRSEFQQILESRAYSQNQINEIKEHQTERNALATEISAYSGLRAHEFLTLRRLEERQPSDRPANEHKFIGRSGHAYTVEGKGGLIREVRIRDDLAERLESLRLNEPQMIRDRNINYESYYSINGGNRWSNSFSQASNRALEFSNGAHGLRHTFAQERMEELQRNGCCRDYALETVSQELGHFRPEITEIYLR